MKTLTPVLDFLKDLKKQLQSGNVKSLSRIRENYGLNPQVLTTIFEMGIVSKNRPYEWNDEFDADEKTAIVIEEQYRLYQPVIVSVNEVINIPDIENGFKIDFRKVWPCLGFARHDNAKRSLLRNFKESVDFEVRRAADLSNELTGLTEDVAPQAEIIMLTLRCALDFLTIVNMPMAKLYSRKMNEFLIERSKAKEIPAIKLETMTITQKMARDAQEVEQLSRNYKTMLTDDLMVKLDNPLQMEFPYMDDLMYDRRKLLHTQISELLTRQYGANQLNYQNNVQAKYALESHREGAKNGRTQEIPRLKRLESEATVHFEA